MTAPNGVASKLGPKWYMRLVATLFVLFLLITLVSACVGLYRQLTPSPAPVPPPVVVCVQVDASGHVEPDACRQP